jgi:hypothetical protein
MGGKVAASPNRFAVPLADDKKLFGLRIGVCRCVTGWLGWFLFGPIEWVWRRMTYNTLIAFRRICQS